MKDDVTGQEPENDRAAGGVQVLARAVSILRALKHEHDGLSLGQIARRVNLPRSTVQRLVAALQAERMVVSARSDGGVRLGPEIHALAEASRTDVVEIARPQLLALSQETGETIDLAVFRGDHLVFVDQVVGQQRLRAVSAIGATFPLTRTANGKACLAMLPEEEIAAIAAQERLGRPMPEFMEEIDEVRKTGIGFDDEEHSQGIKALGVAFRDRAGTLYAISVPVPAMRFDDQKHFLRRALIRARDAILADIG